MVYSGGIIENDAASGDTADSVHPMIVFTKYGKCYTVRMRDIAISK